MESAAGMARILAQSSPRGDALHLKASGKASEVCFRPVNEMLESLPLAAMRRRYYDGSHPIPRIESVGVKYRRFHTDYAALNVLYSSVAGLADSRGLACAEHHGTLMRVHPAYAGST